MRAWWLLTLPVHWVCSWSCVLWGVCPCICQFPWCWLSSFAGFFFSCCMNECPYVSGACCVTCRRMYWDSPPPPPHFSTTLPRQVISLSSMLPERSKYSSPTHILPLHIMLHSRKDTHPRNKKEGVYKIHRESGRDMNTRLKEHKTSYRHSKWGKVSNRQTCIATRASHHLGQHSTHYPHQQVAYSQS